MVILLLDVALAITQLCYSMTATTIQAGSCANSSQLKYRVELLVLQTKDTDLGFQTHLRTSCARHTGVSPSSVDQVTFTNTGSMPQQLCLNNMQLLDGNAVL